jgi:chromosome partitioning protein
VTDATRSTHPCSVCGRAFTPRLAFQTDASGAAPRYFCSLPCKAAPAAASCAVCSTSFTPIYAYQARRAADGSTVHVCSEVCVARLSSGARAQPKAVEPRRIAVLNQKGGTGKTTTSINLAAGLAEAGKRVLLIDADPQGNVGVSLGVRSRITLYHVLAEEEPLASAIVPINNHLDVVTSDEHLAAAEIKLAARPKRAGILKAAIDREGGYDYVLVDCGPSLGLLNQNALCAVSEVFVPVACDYLSLVGVKQVMKTLKMVNQHLAHRVEVGAVLPTFYDARARICRDAYETLQGHFKDRCLTPVRNNIRIKEAPSRKKTIFEHAPESNGAEDYRTLVRWVLERDGQPVASATPAKVAPAPVPEVNAPLPPGAGGPAMRQQVLKQQEKVEQVIEEVVS